MSRTFPYLQAIIIGMLLCAMLVRCPYGYYTVLKFVCCGGMSYLAYLSFRNQKIGWAWALGTTALIYFPFIKLQLGRPIWILVNVVTVLITLASVVVTQRRVG